MQHWKNTPSCVGPKFLGKYPIRRRSCEEGVGISNRHFEPDRLTYGLLLTNHRSCASPFSGSHVSPEQWHKERLSNFLLPELRESHGLRQKISRCDLSLAFCTRLSSPSRQKKAKRGFFRGFCKIAGYFWHLSFLLLSVFIIVSMVFQLSYLNGDFAAAQGF